MTTSRETINNLIRGQKAERVGLFGAPWEDTVAAWVQQGYPPWLHFGYDVVGLGPEFDLFPLRGWDELPDETDEEGGDR